MAVVLQNARVNHEGKKYEAIISEHTTNFDGNP